MLHIFDQAEPYPDNLASNAGRPGYFSDSVYYHAASLLGLEVKSHSVGYARQNILEMLWLSLNALKTIKNIDNGLVIIWQGYGVYAALANSVFGRETRFILNTYKVPSNGPQALKTRINDRLLLGKAIEAAGGVIVISKSQASTLMPYNPNVLWLPFASDASWWTPGLPDDAFLASHGIGYRDYVLVMGDVYRDEETTLKAVSDLKHPILRVTRSPQTALAAQEAFRALNITHGNVLVNVSFELLREIYRCARVVVVPARNRVYPAGMTSLTEAMSCGRPVVIPAGLTTEGYVQDGCDAFVLNEWEESAIRDLVERVYATEIGETVGGNARNTVEERLNFHESGRKLADFIASLGTASDSPGENQRG